jgi:uncharacterized protein YggE
MKNILSFLIFVASLGFFSQGFSQDLNMSQLPALVTVTGTAKLYAEPDEVHFTITINTEGADLLGAKQENSDLTGKAITYLRSQGVEDRHIQTSKQEELLDKARLKAVVDAREKAKALANELGQKIGPAYSITDVQNSGGGNLVYGRAMSMDAESSTGPSIAIGELTVSHSVTVAFHLLEK